MNCVYGLFKTSMALELGLNALMDEGFGGDRLRVVMLEAERAGSQKLLDTMYGTDGFSMIDGMAISAAVGMVLGVIYGSIMYIGSITMGLIGFGAGGGVGYLLDRGILRKKRVGRPGPAGDVIVAVNCVNEEEAARVQVLMREYRVVALGKT